MLYFKFILKNSKGRYYRIKFSRKYKSSANIANKAGTAMLVSMKGLLNDCCSIMYPSPAFKRMCENALRTAKK